jgi:hypothetical protein
MGMSAPIAYMKAKRTIRLTFWPVISISASKRARATQVILAITLFGSCSLAAQVGQPNDSQPTSPPSSSEPNVIPANAMVSQTWDGVRLSVFAGYSYVAPGEASFSGAKGGNSGAQSVTVGVMGNVPVTERWFVPLGIGWGHILLDSVPGEPVPERIDTLHLLTGLGYRINEQWTVAATAGPVFYRFDDITGNDIGAGGIIRAVYRPRRDLTVLFGFGFNPDSVYPVLPVAGARWDVRTNLTLNLMFPKSGVIYRVAPRLSLFAGADFKFAVFRSDNDLGNQIGQPRFNNALATYQDIHLGVGADYRIARGLSVSLEGGYSVGRSIHYKDLDETVKFDPSPYVQASVRWWF